VGGVGGIGGWGRGDEGVRGAEGGCAHQGVEGGGYVRGGGWVGWVAQHVQHDVATSRGRLQ
jgi:hypothetical protein